MILLQAEHLQKTHGMKVIFDDISVYISNGDKIGLIGRQRHGQEHAAQDLGRGWMQQMPERSPPAMNWWWNICRSIQILTRMPRC